MVPAFKTRKGDPAVEIPNVGLVDDKDGVPLERAAETMPELQDEHGKPLKGKELSEAAEQWAEKVGLVLSTARQPQSGQASNDDKE